MEPTSVEIEIELAYDAKIIFDSLYPMYQHEQEETTKRFHKFMKVKIKRIEEELKKHAKEFTNEL